MTTAYGEIPEQPRAVGWFFTYTPLELLDAAGLKPYRILGAPQQTIGRAGALLQGNVCSYTLNVLDCALDAQYQFLSGIVAVNYCDAARRLYDAWIHYLNPRFAYMIDLPKVPSPAADDFFYSEVVRLKRELEIRFNTSITDDRLERSIALYNDTRLLLRQLYETRKQDPPPVSGSELFALIQETMTGGREGSNQRLREALSRAKSAPPGVETGRPRVLVSGSMICDPGCFQLIEECGADIVCDDLCVGTKYFAMEVRRNGEGPLRSLSDAYIRKMPSSLIQDAGNRLKNLIQLANDYRADGIIHQVVKFCNPHITDVPYFRKKLREAGIPALFIEREHLLEGSGQLKTRIQAFLETL